jgi:hypothetical protein
MRKGVKQFKITSYMEIGCRWGGTFVLTTEYLKKFNDFKKSVAIDIIDSPVKEYCKLNNNNNNTEFLQLNSTSQEFKDYIDNHFFDLILIDGDHKFKGVNNDYFMCKNNGKILVFHDIVNVMCPGVVAFWKGLKEGFTDLFDFYEFTDQYDEVVEMNTATFLGIGVAVRKGMFL